MKTRISAILFFTVILLGASCTKQNKAAYVVEGTYSGYFDGTYEGVETSVSDGYTVVVTAIDKSTARVEGVDFDTFDALVTKNGINVELVNTSTTITNFLYLGADRKLQFTYSKDGNTCSFIGTKPE